MAKYGSFKYGGAKYGYSDPGRRLSWGLVVDWTGDGFVTGYNEAFAYGENEHKMFQLNTKAGRQYFINSNGNNFQPVDSSQMQVQLYDRAGRYDPFNTDGPLYQNILPGRKFKLIMQDETTQTIHPIMTGSIEDIRPNYGTVSTVTITGRNGMEDLKNTVALSSGVYTSITAASAITNALSAAGWTAPTNIDTSITDTMPYWWLSGNSAYEEINDVTFSSRGLFFIAKDGTATYYSSVNSPTPTINFVDNDALLSYGIRVPTPWEAIKNYARVYAKARTANAATTLWALSGIPSIDGGSSITIWAEFNASNSTDVAATLVTTPVATTDYTANTNPSGSGTNLTSAISIALTTYATSAKLVISNASASVAYITKLQLRGTNITADQYTFAEYSDQSSINLYKRRDFTLKTNWIQSVNNAYDYASTIIKMLASPKQFPRFVVRNKPAKQFAIDIFDVVGVNFESHKLTGDLRVGYMEHNWVITNGDIVDTTIYLEPNIAGNITGSWTFPTLFDVSSKF